MTLLIDENLPATMVGEFCEFVHASSLGKRPTDDELWELAKSRDMVILTKDTDFFNRMVSEGPPPKVVWLRVGNMRRRDLERFFRECWPSISKLLSNNDLIEVFSNQIEALSFSKE